MKIKGIESKPQDKMVIESKPMDELINSKVPDDPSIYEHLALAKQYVSSSPQDIYNKYKDTTPAEYIYNQSRYRNELGMDGMSYSEIASALRGRDPYESEEERDEREKKLLRAELSNKIVSGVGSLLGNLLNVYRVSRGNPSMVIGTPQQFSAENQNRIDAIRAYNDKISKDNYNTYLTALTADRNAAAAKAAADREFKEKVYLKQMDNNTPLARLKYLNEVQKGRNLEKQGSYIEAQTNKMNKEAELLPRKYALDARMANARINYYNKRASNVGKSGPGGSGTKKYIEVNGRVYSPDKDGQDWIAQAYNDVIRSTTHKSSDGKTIDSPYKINLTDGALTNERMYDAIARYKSDTSNFNKYKGW